VEAASEGDEGGAAGVAAVVAGERRRRKAAALLRGGRGGDRGDGEPRENADGRDNGRYAAGGRREGRGGTRSALTAGKDDVESGKRGALDGADPRSSTRNFTRSGA